MHRLVVGATAAALATVPCLPWAAAAAPGAPQLPVRVVEVDGSQRSRTGVVLSVLGAGEALPQVRVAGGTGPVWVRRRRSAEAGIVVLPEPGRGPGAWRTQQLALARFMLRLPTDVEVGVSDGSVPAPRPDVLAEVQRIMALPPGPSAAAYPRLLAGLQGLSRGGRTRHFVLLASGSDLPSGAVADYLRRRLRAERASLYLLDLSRDGLPVLGSLAAASGGLVLPAGRTLAPATLNPLLDELTGQYAVTFRRSAAGAGTERLTVALPGRAPARVLVRVPAATAAPPVGPPPPVPADPGAARPSVPLETLFPLVAGLLVVIGVSYGMAMLIASRRSPRRRVPDPHPTGDLLFVFLLPCLNEERVILASLERLAAIPSRNYAAMVIDDGSDDATAELVGRITGERVWLLRRTAPEARQGKGEALNAAIGHLLAGDRLSGRDPDQVIIVVVDADGRLDPGALAAVTPFFADPEVGGVQIGVRINNRFSSLLARLQDMEFVIYTDVFQRGRRHLGSVGMGGNGQFMRLSALLSLGQAPWTRSLTEDLDLGIRLLNTGWRNEFCHTAAVHQQGVTQLRRLIRQRSRWFQGHLQSWRLLPSVLRSAPRRAAPDLVYHLTSPALLLIGSLLTLSFLVSFVAALAALAAGARVVSWWVLTTYTLSFGPAISYTALYWAQERRNGLRPLKALGLAHLYVGYGLVWVAAGWWGLVRQLRGRTGWAKTERLAEGPAGTSSTVGGPR